MTHSRHRIHCIGQCSVRNHISITSNYCLCLQTKILILPNCVLMLYWYILRKNQCCYKNTCCARAGLAVALLVMVAAENHFYFRHESLIEYDREKMRVWGRWCLQILPNNQEDASDQPVSPSCACYFISFIFLVNFTWMKVCGAVGVSHQPCT